MIVQFENVTKGFPHKTLFENVNFTINKNDRAGLIGLNGIGKTTLIKLVTGDEIPDKGRVNKPRSLNMGCLYQEMFKEDNRTLYTAMMEAYKHLVGLQTRIKKLEKSIENDEIARKKYGELLHDFEHNGGYDIDLNINKVLTGLSFTGKDFERSLVTFSGGEKRRAGLAYLLLKKPEFLILDEPTNHLDLISVKWLENYLLSWDGALLIISHDRYFLDKTINRVLEIENKQVNLYSGNYEDYIAQKKQRIELQQKEYEKQQEKIKQTEEFIRRNIAGQKTKLAQSRRKMLAKMERISPVHEQERKILINHWKIDKSFNHVLDVKELTKTFDAGNILDSVNMDLYRGERIAVIGANGTGKTTFLKIVCGEDNDYSGQCKLGERVDAFYFSQNLDNVKGPDKVFDYIHSKIPMSTNNEVMNLLAWFYFKGDEAEIKLDNLSGGEKSRLLILSVLLSGANFLLLDEPTNHLDIYTRESLAEALTDFPGSILFISHDRYFIDEVATKIFVLSNGSFTIINGGFSENEEKIMSLFKLDKETGELNEKTEKVNQKPVPEKKNVNVYKVNKIEEEISRLDTLKQELEQSKFAQENYKDGRKMKEISDKISEIDKQIEQKMNEWEQYH